MSITSRISNLVTWPVLAPGEAPPNLSLTADQGTWIRLEDFKGHVNVVLLFFRSLSDDATDAWLKGFHQRLQQFEDFDTAIFGVTTYKTDRLRDFRASLGLEFYLLYDPLAIDSRAFHASSRWRPACKNTVYVIGKDGTIAFSERGLPDAQTVLSAVARLEGGELPVDTPQSSNDFTGIRDPGKAADRVKTISSEQAIALLAEDDSPYVLVDVRTLSEYEADHVPGSLLIPLDELPHRYREIGQTTHIICIGQAGDRSAAAAEFLTSIGGSEICDVESGMAGWSGDRVSGAAQ